MNVQMTNQCGVGSAHGQADAGAYVGPRIAQPDRFGEGGDDPFGDLSGVSPVRQAFEQDGELVAAEPRDRIAGSDRVGQPLGNDPEQLVASGVAQGVVDILEVVEVDEQ